MVQIKKELDQLRKSNVQLIAVSNSEWYSLFKDEIRNSIAIEGIFANRNDLLNVLERNKRTDSEKTAAILGYYEAASSVYEYANNLYKEGEFQIRLSDVKQIHTQLMRYESQLGTFTGIRGDFRREDVEVTESGFTPVKAYYLNDVMQLFVRWINQKLANSEYDKIKLATLSHILFETIHPFRDGNGRVGRIFLSFILIGCGYINIAIKGTTRDGREKYYDALEIGDDECEDMLRAIENGQKITASQVDAWLENSNIEPLQKIIEGRLRDAIKRLQNVDITQIQPDGLIPLRDVARFYNYSQDYLRNLINKGNLPAQRKGKLWYVKVRDMETYLKSVSE